MKITAEPRSDQWNADDFIGGPRTFTIARVVQGKAEQKYDIELVEGDGRVWRPPPTVVRLLMKAWGDESDVWTGRRVQLYRDDTVRFGPDAVGGIRVTAMSDLPGGKTMQAKVTEKRGKRALVTVDPLPDDAPSAAPPVDIAAMTDVATLRSMWQAATPTRRKDIEARVAALTKPVDDTDPWAETQP